jgi:TPR repeat protein
MYRRGRGVERDRALALKWSLSAAQRGVPGAQYEVGVLISGRPHDRAERVAAYAWFLLAERARYPGVRQNLDLLNRKMHQVDIDQAVGIADAWTPPADAWTPPEATPKPPQ